MAEEFENLNEIPEDETEEQDSDVIELVDEEGETQAFEVLGTFDMDGVHYIALADPEEDEDAEETQVFILRTETDEDGNDTYVSLEDEEMDRAFAYFLNLVDAESAEE